MIRVPAAVAPQQVRRHRLKPEARPTRAVPPRDRIDIIVHQYFASRDDLRYTVVVFVYDEGSHLVRSYRSMWLGTAVDVGASTRQLCKGRESG